MKYKTRRKSKFYLIISTRVSNDPIILQLSSKNRRENIYLEIKRGSLACNFIIFFFHDEPVGREISRLSTDPRVAPRISMDCVPMFARFHPLRRVYISCTSTLIRTKAGTGFPLV